ncbi:MAG: cyanophycinase [Halanaerobiaceae bacterium]|nr:cyanophycinase [Halanaerobiaceae bacterium]
MGEKVRGSLLLIGGAEDKSGDKEILRSFCRMVQERGSSLVILTSAAEEGASAGLEYQRIFEELGIGKGRILDIDSRKKAESVENARLLEEADGIFFTGGDQLRITSIFGATRVNAALKKAYENGAVIAGTSAGASVVSYIMIVGGKGEESPRMDSVRLAAGLGLVEELVIDQHFAQRGRMNRLLFAVAYNPHILGIGIDEDTAIELGPEAVFTVRGSHTVTVIDGKGITHSNISELKGNQSLALLDVKIHVLPAMYSYNLQERKVIIPG